MPVLDSSVTPRDHRCLICGKTMAAEGYARIRPLCPGCATKDHPIPHPHWLAPGPVESFRVHRDAYDLPGGRP